MDSVLNNKTISSLKEVGKSLNDQNYLEELCTLFQKQTNSLLAEIISTLGPAQFNTERAKTLVHKLKGSAQSMGATDLAEKCLIIESSFKEETGDKDVLLMNLKQSLNKTITELTNELIHKK